MAQQGKTANAKELRVFGLVMAAFVAITFGIVVPWIWGFRLPAWPWLVGVLLILLAATTPRALGPVQRGWLALGHGLNWIVSRAALVLIYYAVVLPIGIAMRLCSRNPIGRGFERKVTTYRVPSERADQKHVERPF